MTTDQILSLGPQLADFLGEFDDCFPRSEPRGHLASYVKGQLSDLPRKSVQPIADFNGTPRRTLQEFLDWSPWDRGLIPEDVVYRSKHEIALDQVRHALANGVYFAWLTFDEWYTTSADFLASLETLEQRYVGEVRRSFHGWLCDPRCETRAVYRDVETLCRYSHAMMCQPWQRVYVKDTEKGPMVWEVKHAPFWLRRDDQILGPYWLIYARNVLDPREEKYFLSNARPGTPREVILHVAFARWPMERTLEDKKDELGLSHFEVRKYDAILRHFAVTQVSHLFLARQTERLRGEKPGDHSVPGPHRYECSDRCAAIAPTISEPTPAADRAEVAQRPTPERRGSPLSHDKASYDFQSTAN